MKDIFSQARDGKLISGFRICVLVSALQIALALRGKRKVGEIAIEARRDIDDISVDASRMTTMSESNATLRLLQDATPDTASL